MIKSVMVILNLIIALLFFTMLYSAANVDVNIQVNTSSGFSVNGDNLQAAVPVTVKNNGLYPIKDVVISLNITNSSKVVYEKTFKIKEIEALKEYNGVFNVVLNLTELYKKLGDYYLFHEGKFKINIDVHAHYWVLAEFEANYSHDINWHPLLYAYHIYTDEIKFQGDDIVVPYFISKLPINVNATLSMVVKDSWGTIAKGFSKLIFDRKSKITLHLVRSIDYLLTKKETWNILCKANINGLVVEKEFKYQWVPPVTNLAIGETLVNNTPYIYLSFKNNYNSPLNVEIMKAITHDGNLSNGYENLTVEPQKIATVYLFPLQRGNYHVEITIVVKNLNLRKTISYDLEV